MLQYPIGEPAARTALSAWLSTMKEKGLAAARTAAGTAARSGRRVAAGAALAAATCIASTGASLAQGLPFCAWPVGGTPEGVGNIAFPDTYSRSWWMPFDTTQYETLTFKGTFPNARFFSLVVYNGEASEPWVPSGIAEHFYDQEIVPDPGSVNPFVPVMGHGRKAAPPEGGAYTIDVTRGDPSGLGDNTITVDTDYVWVLLRIYVPDNGSNLTGGVPLPRVSLTDYNGQTTNLDLCSPVNSLESTRNFMQILFPPGFDLEWQEDQVPPESDRLWFAPPKDPPDRLFRNPDNKYILMMPGPYQQDRLIVIHGKAMGFPDTYDGGNVWDPIRGFRSLQVRYWSLCNNDFQLPLAVVACATDFTTPLVGGDYDIVVTNDMVRPDWLGPRDTWVPWGDGDVLPGTGDKDQIPKVMIFRNMLSDPDFEQSVQKAIDATCTFDFVLPYVPLRADLDKAGMCAADVMGDYYPVAAWCDRSTFIHGGWKACLKDLDGF